MRIGEVCESTGLTKKAVLYYEGKKMISPTISKNGYREFSESDLGILHKIRVFRDLGLSISEIIKILDASEPLEELRKVILKREAIEETEKRKIQLLKDIGLGKDMAAIQSEIEELNKLKTIKIKILEAFPSFLGRVTLAHFGQFIDEPILTTHQKKAYAVIIEYFDTIELPKLPDETPVEYEAATLFWDDKKLAELEKDKIEAVKKPVGFLKDHDEILIRFDLYKRSEEYLNSGYKEYLEKLTSEFRSTAYEEVFIPAMRELSPAYNDYFKKMLESNKHILKHLKTERN